MRLKFLFLKLFPVGNYMFKVNNRDPWTRCEICSKLTIKTPEQRHWRRSGVFIVTFWTYFTPCSSISIVNFEQVMSTGLKAVVNSKYWKESFTWRQPKNKKNWPHYPLVRKKEQTLTKI